MTIAISTLFSAATAEEILDLGLGVARAVGLKVSTWRAGDPTRTAFKFLAKVLGAFETYAVQYAKSGFLSSAEGDWKTLAAQEMYGVERPAASYATSTVSLSNDGGGWYDVAAGDLTVSSSVSGVTYHSVEACELHGPGTTADVAVEADVAGSEGSALSGEIDTIVTSLLGVEITDSTAAVGTDAASDTELDTLCEVSLGPLSPNGPPEAYEAVALDSELTGTEEVARAQSSEDSPTGAVTLWVASTTGAPSSAAVDAVQAAVDLWSAPLCITPTVITATPDSINCTAVLDGDDLPADATVQCEAAYIALLAATPIGGLLSRSAIVSAFHSLLVNAGATNVSVTLTVPATDTQLEDGHVAIEGSIAITEA